MEFQRKPDYDKIIESAQRRRINAIYHFTVVERLPSIFKERAILPMSQREKRGIKVIRPSTTWGTPQKAREFQDYVACGIVRPWGMMRNEPQPLAVFALNPRLLGQDGTLFTVKHTGWGDVTLDSIKAKQSIEDFDALFPNLYANIPAPPWAEVLIKGAIPIGEIIEVYFANEEGNKQAKELCKPVLLDDGRRPFEYFPFIEAPWIFGL